jgi:hypothetical protein
MAVSTGFLATLKTWTGGTCTLSNDKLSITGGTCTTIGYLDTYSKNTSRETIDTTAFGDKIRKVIPGFPSATVSLSGTYNYADTAQAAIWTEIEGGVTAVEKIIKISEAGSNTVLKGYFTAANSGSSVGSKSTFAAEFTSNTLPNTTA